MSRSEGDRAADIIRAIGRARTYRARFEPGDPETTEMAFDAVLRNLAVIGEAARTLPESIRSSHPEIPWASIIGLRNIVVHEYFDIKHEIIVDIVDNHLAALATALGVGSSAGSDESGC